MALNNLERFVRAGRNPLMMGTFFERDPEALPTLLPILSTSQHLSDLLATDPESFDLLRLTDGRPSARQAMIDEIAAEVAALEHDQAVLRALRRFKRRETLRHRLRRFCPRAEFARGHPADIVSGRRGGRGGPARRGVRPPGGTARRSPPAAGPLASPCWPWANLAGWN